MPQRTTFPETPPLETEDFWWSARQRYALFRQSYPQSDKYWAHVGELSRKPPLLTLASLFITQVLANSSKLIRENVEAPELPPGVHVPKEDKYVVRAALISKPVVVTAERKLLNAINSQAADLRLKAVTPAEALELAKDR
jgi:hypothetical protein